LAPLRAGNCPIWGIGEWAVSAYRDEFGRSRDYLNLPYHSDLSRFQEREAQFSEAHTSFLFSGSLSHRKGVDVLATAFRMLAAENPRVRLKVMGEGEWLQRMTRELATVAHQVEWIGFKDWNDLPAVYASAQVLCVPSRHDGWGLVVPEGLASGLPVIASDRTGAALDLIVPDANGWVVRAGDPGTLLDAMRRAAALDRDAWTAMSRQARASITDLSIANGARKLIAGVDRALDGWQGGH
jgi:glycosyltransferase involved in cell wall biosynthesis